MIIQEPSSVEKIMEIDEHIGCAMSGLIADARTLVEHARVETQVRFMQLSTWFTSCGPCMLISPDVCAIRITGSHMGSQ